MKCSERVVLGSSRPQPGMLLAAEDASCAPAAWAGGRRERCRQAAWSEGSALLPVLVRDCVPERSQNPPKSVGGNPLNPVGVSPAGAVLQSLRFPLGCAKPDLAPAL